MYTYILYPLSSRVFGTANMWHDMDPNNPIPTSWLFWAWSWKVFWWTGWVMRCAGVVVCVCRICITSQILVTDTEQINTRLRRKVLSAYKPEMRIKLYAPESSAKDKKTADHSIKWTLAYLIQNQLQKCFPSLTVSVQCAVPKRMSYCVYLCIFTHKHSFICVS